MNDSDDARRLNQRRNANPSACSECYGNVWLGSGYLPHDPGCTRLQDQERAALSRLGALVTVPMHDFDCPCDWCENDRRRVLTKILRMAGQRSSGLRPKPLTGEEL